MQKYNINTTRNSIIGHSKFVSLLKGLSLLSTVCILFFLTTFSTFASEEAKRILSLVDYIGGDYKNAVQDGRIINEQEYTEMVEFSSDAMLLYENLESKSGQRSQIGTDLIHLESKIKTRSPVNEIELLSKDIKDKLISEYGIVPYPRNKPSYASGRELYKRNCSQCHGLFGSGDGPLASNFNPLPSSFNDFSTTGSLSPFKVFNTMGFGIEDTAMPSFPMLSEEEKWNIAFYTMSLSITEEATNEGRLIITPDFQNELEDYKVLALLSNDEIKNKIDRNDVSEKDIPKVIAHLRRGIIETPESKDDSLLITSSTLATSFELYKQGKKDEAYEEALDAYLNGFENAEASLILKDRELTYEIEAKLSKFREAIKEGRPAQNLEILYDEITNELNRASIILKNGKPVGQLLSFTNSLSIVLREGLEAILIIAAILAFLATTGASNAIKYVHLGWILAIAAGLLTWLIANTLISISGAKREIIEGTTSLIAAAVLFYVSYWLITKIEVKKWKDYIQSKVQLAISKKSVFALASVSFFAVYREAFETILFYQALWFQAENSKGAIVWGFVLGILSLLVLVFVIFKLAVRVPLKYFFTLTSLFLYSLSFILIGKGMRELQEAGVLGITPIKFIPQIDILGIYPTLETSIPQGILLVAFLVAISWLGYIKREKDKNEIVISVTRIADDMKSMHESFDHIKKHIIEWRRCEEIDIEAEELDTQIQGVISHVDELETKLLDFYDVVSKNREPLGKT
ncbi:cytochrome c/FTR1 family iron permease [Desulfobacterota bacterium AH_259_B03_O07]|nr:cytochrome c/FTR1 family iron permease [Desulfobacterota bacterium AH_259_B03_O07]